MTTHTTLSNAVPVLGRSRTAHTPPAPCPQNLPATLPKARFEPTRSQHARYENSTRNKFDVSGNAPSLRRGTRLALATNHPSLITTHGLRNRLSSLFQIAATRPKSIECNFEID